jgi:hypothetical protein
MFEAFFVQSRKVSSPKFAALSNTTFSRNRSLGIQLVLGPCYSGGVDDTAGLTSSALICK